MRRQVLMFVGLLDWLPIFRHRRRLRSLDPEQRLRFLEGLQNSRWPLIRRGVWGLRTLVFMGYYARPMTQAAIRYRGHPDGWERQ